MKTQLRQIADPVVRSCVTSDIPRITAIYGHYVLNSRCSFETTPPDQAEMVRRWRAAIDVGLPYLVAECEGVLVGFAYAAPYRSRPAYRHTVEDSIYVDAEFGGRGVGRALLTAVIDACEAADYRQMVAVITDDDSAASVALHRALGFRDAGRLKAIGHKHGRWLDTIRMQRSLGSDREN